MDFTTLLNSFSSIFGPSPIIKKSPLTFTVVILSPHPDDESIVGSLALRLQHENNARIINVAVTLGSNKKRQEERRKELNAATELLKMETVFLSDNWKAKERELKSFLKKTNPQLIIAPHLKDHHPAHIKTGELLKLVLPTLKKNTLLVAWSEFWGQLHKPNILIEVPQKILELQMKALVKHKGEIERNPYHLRLPAWMMDNVRRGTELVGRKDQEAPAMAFGILYQLQLFKNGKLSSVKNQPFFNTETDIGQKFQSIIEAASGSSTKVK